MQSVQLVVITKSVVISFIQTSVSVRILLSTKRLLVLLLLYRFHSNSINSQSSLTHWDHAITNVFLSTHSSNCQNSLTQLGTVLLQIYFFLERAVTVRTA